MCEEGREFGFYSNLRKETEVLRGVTGEREREQRWGSGKWDWDFGFFGRGGGEEEGGV